MTAAILRRGASPVGLVADLPPVEARAVRCLRTWCDGPEARDRISAEFSDSLGAQDGQGAFASLNDLCELCVRYGRRPLMRHKASCRCLGADEAAFAMLVANAADGARDDCMLMATLLVRPDLAPVVAALAQEAGLALKRQSLISETWDTHYPTQTSAYAH